jgi:hypothetical protein
MAHRIQGWREGLSKRSVFLRLRVIGILLGIGLLILTAFYLRLRLAKDGLDAYLRSSDCPKGNPCRQEMSVTILEGEQVMDPAPQISPRYRSMGQSQTKSVFKVVFPDAGMYQRIELIPEIPVETSYLGIESSNLPPKDYAILQIQPEHNLRGTIVRVEIWKEQITFLFWNKELAKNWTITTIHALPGSSLAEGVAVPTSKHPAVILSIAEREFQGGLIWTVFIVIILSIGILNLPQEIRTRETK